MRRRTMLAAAAAAALAAAGLAAAPASAQKPLTIVSWGGTYTASQMRAYVNPFREETGLYVEVERYNGGLDEIEAQVTALNVTWDVVDLGLSNAIRGCEKGLLEPIDASILPAAADGTPPAEDFLPGMLRECAVGQNVFSTVIGYDTRDFPAAAPATLADFFNLLKYPGRRGVRRNPRATLEMALMADGVAPEAVYDVLGTAEGVDRAFEKLETIGGNIVWYDGAAEPQALLDEGVVTMTTAYNGRVQARIDRGDPYAIIWDGQVRDYELWAVVKGTRKRDEAMRFVAFASDPARQAEQARHIAYGPARASALAMVPEAIKATLPTAPENSRTALVSDPDFWAENQERLDERFAEFVEDMKRIAEKNFGIGTAR